MMRDPRDPGTLVWVIVTKRRDGGVPLVAKVVEQQFYLDELDAEVVLKETMGHDAILFYEVRPMVVHFAVGGGS